MTCPYLFARHLRVLFFSVYVDDIVIIGTNSVFENPTIVASLGLVSYEGSLSAYIVVEVKGSHRSLQYIPEST